MLKLGYIIKLEVSILKKYLTLEVWIDEEMDDYKECVEDVLGDAMGHEYCCDGTVRINIVEKHIEE